MLPRVSCRSLLDRLARHERLSSAIPPPFVVIDARSPREFREDRLPAARNVPVLTDEEHEAVGTKYLANKFEARTLGASLIAGNIARHLRDDESLVSVLEESLRRPRRPPPLQSSSTSVENGIDPEFNIYVYCARGGMRSESLGIVLSMILRDGRESGGGQQHHRRHHPVALVEGGYKSYRGCVLESFTQENLGRYTFHAVTGLTGSGKTRWLRRLETERGEQIIDLERLANHQGSILGHNLRDPAQPSQRRFESELARALWRMDPARPIWVEAESNRVGNIVIPPPFWRRAVLDPARCVEIRGEGDAVARRAKNICEDENYREWFERGEELKGQLEKLRGILPPATAASLLEEWKLLVDRKAFPELVKSLLVNHYDPRYRKSKVRRALEARGADEVVEYT